MATIVTHKSNLLTIEVEENDTAICLKWIGKSADRTPGIFINPILNDVIQKGDAEAKEVILDFQDLEFMNSSSVAPIVKTLDRAKRGTSRVTIKYRKSLNWQELSFSALGVFKTKDDRIKIIGI
jgi:hypothetical protein